MKNIRYIIPPSEYYAAGHDRIRVIKSLRVLSGMSLQDANVATQPGGAEFVVAINEQSPTNVDKHLKIMSDNGCIIRIGIHKILQGLRVLAGDALSLGNDDLANEILQLIVMEKLRNG